MTNIIEYEDAVAAGKMKSAAAKSAAESGIYELIDSMRKDANDTFFADIKRHHDAHREAVQAADRDCADEHDFFFAEGNGPPVPTDEDMLKFKVHIVEMWSSTYRLIYDASMSQ